MEEMQETSYAIKIQQIHPNFERTRLIHIGAYWLTYK